jgi:hypothetical protein
LANAAIGPQPICIRILQNRPDTDLRYEAGFTGGRGFMAGAAKSVITFFAAPSLQDGKELRRF